GVELREKKAIFRDPFSRFSLLERRLPNKAILNGHGATTRVETMHFKLTWKSIGKVFASLAAGGICLSPLVGQQVGPRLLPTPAILIGQSDVPINLVGFKADGTFRATVLITEGGFVPDAQWPVFADPSND